MNAPLVERRKPSGLDGAAFPSRSDVVRKSLHVKDEIGTVGALEYLRAHAVHGAVIQRILSDGTMRSEDREAVLTG
jgi:hypothetical protein